MPDSYSVCKKCGEDIFCRAYSHHWKHIDSSLDKKHAAFPKLEKRGSP